MLRTQFHKMDTYVELAVQFYRPSTFSGILSFLVIPLWWVLSPFLFSLEVSELSLGGQVLFYGSGVLLFIGCKLVHGYRFDTDPMPGKTKISVVWLYRFRSGEELGMRFYNPSTFSSILSFLVIPLWWALSLFLFSLAVSELSIGEQVLFYESGVLLFIGFGFVHGYRFDIDPIRKEIKISVVWLYRFLSNTVTRSFSTVVGIRNTSEQCELEFDDGCVYFLDEWMCTVLRIMVWGGVSNTQGITSTNSTE